MNAADPKDQFAMQRLGNFCEFKYGKSLPDKSRNGGDFPVYGSNGIVGYHNVPLTAGPTIIIGRKGSAGALQYSPTPCCPIDTTYYVDQTCTQGNLRWLFFTLQNLGLENLNKHVAIPGLNRNDAYEKMLFVPPRDEQKRIAVVLDQADALRRQRQESLQLTEKLLESVFIDMFGDPVRNSKKLPTDDLLNLAKLERGKFTPRPRNDPSYFGGPYPFIQTGDITRSKGRITSWNQTLNAKGVAVSKEFGAGTVVIAIVGATLGETAIVETPVYCPDSIIGITPFPDKATPEFIEFLLRLWKPRLKELAPDAARANLNLERLRPLQALAPDIGEQRSFSRVATDLKSLVVTKNESLQQLDNLFSSLQQRAFRGELDLSRLVLDPSDDVPTGLAPAEAVTKQRKLRAASRSFQTPAALEPALEKLDRIVSQGEKIPWSADYFKHRILGTLSAPFGFSEIMERAEDIFDRFSQHEPLLYDRIRDFIFDMLGQDGKPALLRQRFDLNEVKEKDSAGNERTSFEGRKEIVFEPVP